MTLARRAKISQNWPSHAHDDGFHEIQLSGKQLVFLFMAATVVSVVIFLCGVLVGRGVRAERATAMVEASTPPTEPPLPPPQPAPATPAGSDPTAAAPPPTTGEFTYATALEHPNRAKEDLKAGGAEARAAEGERAAETGAVEAGPGAAVVGAETGASTGISASSSSAIRRR